MEEKKKLTFLTIISFVTLVVAVGVIGYLLGCNNAKDNNLNKTEIGEENKQDIEVNDEITPIAYTPKCVDMSTQENTLMTDIEDTKYNNIFDYIQEQNNVKISINHCKFDENNPNSDNGFVSGTYELTNSEKEIVINEMRNSRIEISPSGIGGVCVSSLKITYERNYKEYYVSYFQFFAMTSNDGNIYKIIDKTVNNTLKEPQYCLYNFNNLSSSAISITNRLIGN